MMQFCTIDFETEAIGPRPNEYPPKPVGVAIRWPDGRSEYLSWGHPSGNNTTFEAARAKLWFAWQHPCVFHNAAFDMEVAARWMGFPFPKEWHDTYFTLFLCYPHAASHSLKPTAEWLLSEPPAERDLLHEWILANVPGATKKNAGAHICKAPVDLVGPYAIGDVERTHAIFARTYPHVQKEMQVPYDRERRLLPTLLASSRNGIRVDRGRLEGWESVYTPMLERCDDELRKRLNNASLNIDANDDVADAIESAGLLCSEGWLRTENGKRSTSKAGLTHACTDALLVDTLVYRNTLATMLRTFIVPWIALSAADGRLHCQWHQTRSERGGTRTGRIASSDPNLANVPNPQDKVKVPFVGLAPLPVLRKALLPEPGHSWLSADYKSQELRILAHYEGGSLMRAFQDDPDLDLHEHARKLILSNTSIALDRKAAKIVGFAQVYGAGIPKLASQLGVDDEKAWLIRNAYFKSLPGVRDVRDAATQRWGTGGHITTWGGRKVKAQPGDYDKTGRWRTYEYKALNMLIQGSAADQTKEAIITMATPLASIGGFFLSQLYDEINTSVPTELLNAGRAIVRTSMEDLPGWDVPFGTDIEYGPSWGDLKAIQ